MANDIQTFIQESIDDGSLEKERQDLISQMETEEEWGEDWRQNYSPGSYGCHELLHTTYLINNLISRELLENPACLQNQEWYFLASQGAMLLQELYQKIGAKHLDAIPEETEPKPS